MINLTTVFEVNRPLVYFIYGKVFFLLGFAIVLRYREFSSLRLARSLRWLAAFGFLHGTSEWATLFIPLQAAYLKPHTVVALYFLELILKAASFACLFSFGAHLLAATREQKAWLTRLSPTLLAFWLANLVLLPFWSPINPGVYNWLAAADAWSRYLLALPGSLLTAWALSLQRSELVSLKKPRLERHLTGAVVSFASYAFFGGLVVPHTPFSPATWLNQEAFFHWLGVPVPVFRAAAGTAMAYYTIRVMEVFDIENQKRVETLERLQLLANERERIGRDLHDGIIQDLYAIGLVLENASYALGEDPPTARRQIEQAMQGLNDTMRDIRSFILGLAPPNLREPNLRLGLEKMLRETEANSLLLHHLDWEGPAVDLPPEDASQIYLIIKEALNNVVKHARASGVKVVVLARPDELEISVLDNGTGFDPASLPPGSPGQGLHNMLERAARLHGTLQVGRRPQGGTHVWLKIPRGGVTVGKDHAG